MTEEMQKCLVCKEVKQSFTNGFCDNCWNKYVQPAINFYKAELREKVEGMKRKGNPEMETN